MDGVLTNHMAHLHTLIHSEPIKHVFGLGVETEYPEETPEAIKDSDHRSTPTEGGKFNPMLCPEVTLN